MHNRRLVTGTLIVLAAVLVGMFPVSAAAQAITTRITAIEIFDPQNMLGGGPVGRFTDAGTLSCPGGQPTGNPMQPCSPGSLIHLRGVTGTGKFVSESPWLRGWFSWEMHANFDAFGTGRAWGTFRIDLDAGGTWEGSWTNERSRVEDVRAWWVGRALFVGRGTGGGVEGMHLRFTETATTYTLLPFFWIVPIDAEVLATPSR